MKYNELTWSIIEALVASDSNFRSILVFRLLLEAAADLLDVKLVALVLALRAFFSDGVRSSKRGLTPLARPSSTLRRTK